MWWKTCLKGTSTNSKDFFSSTKKDLMTWWLDERLVWRGLQKLRETSSSSTNDLMTWWKTCLKGASKTSKYFFFFFFNKRLDDFMKDWLEGDFKVLERLLLLQQKTWWLDERHVWRELQKLRGTSSSSTKDLMTWWKTNLDILLIFHRKTW